MTSLAPSSNCPHCLGELVPGKLFCPTCGLAIAPPDQKLAIDAYITAKVSQEVALLTKDQTAMVREIGNKAEDEVWTRLKRYTWLTGAAVVLLGVYGWTSIQDAKKTIVDEARGRVEPVVKQVENRAQAAQQQLAAIESQLPGVTTSLNQTAKLADAQRKRIEGQSSEVESKLNGFQSAATKADQLSTGFESKVGDAQKRLDDLTRRYDTQLNQISQSASHQSVLEAFPTLAQEPFVQVQGVRLDKIQKKPGEKWVNVYLTGNAIAKNLISPQKLEQLVTELRAAGFTPFLGIINTGGRMGGILENAGQGSSDASHVYYFHTDFESSARQLLGIASKYIQFADGAPLEAKPTAVNNTYVAPRLEFLIKDAKLDAQLFISAP